MSEKSGDNCLNCGTNLVGMYCHECGQPANTRKITLVNSFLNTFDHLDFNGPLLNTIKQLYTKPASMIKAYLDGKRRSLIPSIRMFLMATA